MPRCNSPVAQIPSNSEKMRVAPKYKNRFLTGRLEQISSGGVVRKQIISEKQC